MKYGIGYTVRSYDVKMKDEIYNWYHNLDFSEFNSNCEAFIKTIEEENAVFDNAFNRYLV